MRDCINVNGQSFTIGEMYWVWDKTHGNRVAVGKLCRVFRNAVELDCTELNGNIGAHGKRQFLFSKYTIA